MKDSLVQGIECSVKKKKEGVFAFFSIISRRL